MGKRRRRRDREDIIDISNTPVLRSIIHELTKSSHTFLRSLEDRREFHPGLTRPARAFRRRAAQVDVPRKPIHRAKHLAASPITNLKFVDPSRVAVCIRRKQRREVILASGRGGRTRKPRYSEYSDIKCK